MICDRQMMDTLLREFEPDAVLHLAAESHVDRSIDGRPISSRPTSRGPACCSGGASILAEASGRARGAIPFSPCFDRRGFRLARRGRGSFTETTRYQPNSPYSASKAAADHLVRAWRETFGLPTVISNCSNNYGPCHFPEKLIPLTILKALHGEPIPVYGTGDNIRDWLYVEDHARALHS